MPSINRIRVNNVKYNFGTQYYDDFTMRMYGKNTLYDLANGGGKSVLMLLLMQNMIPNCTLDEKQPIEKLFRTGNGNTTIHSLVEWKLDEQDRKEGHTLMEKDTGSFEDIARNKLAQAIDDLESADILLGADKYRAANNRAYYAVFHAIDAVLSMEPVAFKKHKDVIAYFNKNYVNKDVFSRDMGRKISKLEIIRHKSDYDDFYIASKLDTVNQVTIAKEIIGEIKTYLNME